MAEVLKYSASKKRDRHHSFLPAHHGSKGHGYRRDVGVQYDMQVIEKLSAAVIH
jgi:hypothetical protein